MKDITELLRKETERMNRVPVGYSVYDTSLDGYVVIPVKPKESNQQILEEYEYEPVTDSEIQKAPGLRRYPKKELFKIKIEKLEEIHK